VKCCRDPGESAKGVVGVGDVAVTVVVITGGMMQLMNDGLGIGIWIVTVEFGLIRAEEGAVVGDAEFEEVVILILRFPCAIDGTEDAGAVVADALAGAVEVAVVVTVEFNADMGQ
jgi:hypothetical protein